MSELNSSVLKAFGAEETAKSERFTGGHINDTFFVKRGRDQLVIQRINRFVFPEPEKIMENMVKVTDFLREKIAASGGDPDREALTVVKTTDGEYHYIDENGELWRCTLFVDNATAHETITGPAILEEAGYAFGNFQHMLGEFPADQLHEIIADFHNTPMRYQQLMDAAKNDKKGRLASVAEEMEFVQARKEKCSLLMNMLADGSLPLRVTHNDTKMSNILIDDETGKAICVIDLDTVMPGLVAFDFGDSIRAGATTAAEDEADLSKINFSMELYDAYTKGFLEAAGDALTENELKTLPDGAILMTLEVGMRFLADYLNGDVYFKTAYPEHNLVRARNQLKLVKDMEQVRDEMGKIVEKYSK